MSERDDLDDLTADEPDLDADLADDEGWDEEYENEVDSGARVARAPAHPAGALAASSARAAAAPARLPRPGVPDARAWLVAGAGLLVALPLSLGVLAAAKTSPAALLGLAPAADGAAARLALPFVVGLAVTVVLALATGLLAAAWANRLAARQAQAHALLDAMAGLDLEEARGWQAPVIIGDPAMAAFTERILGAYRLQQAKLTRYVGLEGELHRLGKAIARAEREDLEGQWDNVAVGTVADEALRLIDRVAAAEGDLAAARKSVADHGPDLVAQLAEARSWTTAAIEQVNAQGAAVERLAVKLGRLGEPAGEEPRGKSRQEQIVAAIRQDLAELPARHSRQDGENAHANLTRLVDRGSKLAFQLAMEVARLGVKNERLLPMTQDLEELTTELRGVVAARAEGDQPERVLRILENVRGRLAELASASVDRGDDASGGVRAAAGELMPAARQVSQALQQVSRGIGGQAQRLDQLLDAAAGLTGIEVPATASADPLVEPGSGLLVDRFDPFHAGRPGEAPGVLADPFAHDRSIFNPAASSSEFSQSVLPGLEAQPDAASGAVAATPAETMAPPPREVVPAASDPAPMAPPPREVTPAVSAPAPPPVVDEDRVHELSEFGAEPLDAQDDGADDPSPVYDLVEFGAERIA